MKILLSPADITILEAAKNHLNAIYTAQIAINNEVISNDDLFKAATTIDNLLREYNLTISGIKEREYK